MNVSKKDLKKNYDNLNVSLTYGRVKVMHSHILKIWLIRWLKMELPMKARELQ